MRRALLFGLSALASCTGAIVTPPGGTGGGGTETACTADPVDPGPLLMRRLTNAEYQQSVSWLLGVDAAAAVATFPADLKRTGFDNGYELQTVSVTHADRYHATAKALVETVFADPTKRAALLGCDPAANRAACLKGFISTFGRRAFRRPLETAEVDTYFMVSETETDPLIGAQLATRAMLESPKFLWRVEIGEPVSGSPYLKLTGLELAARLSFFLWGGPPDDALLASAENGELDTPESVEAKARSMLSDPRAAASFERFTDQWFGFDKLQGLTRSAALFPGFDDALKASMRGEVHALFSRHLWTPNTPLLDLYTATHTTIDATLAGIYSVAGAGDTDWTQDANRGGLFATAGLLTLTARNDFTSPIQRGLYVREAVLCEHLAPPLGGVPPIMAMPGESQEEAESRHTSDPNCTGCHSRIDPVGLGLERYDAIGKLRSTYPNGKPVPMSGRIEGIAGSDYAGAKQLGTVLRGATDARRCAVQHAFRWATARMEQKLTLDACTLEQLDGRFTAAGLQFQELVIALVKHDVFRMRRPAD